MTTCDTDGSLYLDGRFIGTVEGFSFQAETAVQDEEQPAAAARIDNLVAEEIKNRVAMLAEAEDGELSLILGNPLIRSHIFWRGVPLARVVRGSDILLPQVIVQDNPLLQGAALETVQTRLDRWLANHVGEVLAPLFVLKEALDETPDAARNEAQDADGKLVLGDMVRPIVAQMLEKLGTIPRRLVARDFRAIDREGRFQMKRLGIWLGAASFYIPGLLKPAPAQLRLFLWALFYDKDTLPVMPAAGLCTITIDPAAPRSFYEVSGYRVVSRPDGASRPPLGVRLDMLERLANTAREISLKGPFPALPDLMSLVGVSGDDFAAVMGYLGYVAKKYSPEKAAKIMAPIPDVSSEISESETPNSETSASETSEPKTSENPPEQPVGPLEPEEDVILFSHQPYRKDTVVSMSGKHTGRPDRLSKTPRKSSHKSSAKGKGRPSRPATRKTAPPVLDPHSPFAALADLKDKLKTKI